MAQAKWTIDKEAKVATVKCWGGTMTASKTAKNGGWLCVWTSDAVDEPPELDDGEEHAEDWAPPPALKLTSGVHYLERFGIDGIPTGDDPIPELKTAASYEGPTEIWRHLENLYKEHHAYLASDERPSVFIGPDPF